MSQAKSGDTVRIHYTGTLDDGTEFDSSKGRDPLEFAIGGGQVIPGFDSAVEGMAVGENKSVTIEPDQAYGARHDQLVQEVPKSALPDDLEAAGEPAAGCGGARDLTEEQVVNTITVGVFARIVQHENTFGVCDRQIDNGQFVARRNELSGWRYE